jgi:hypothetical protein
VERYTGGSEWSVQNPHGMFPGPLRSLAAVSCASGDACTAIGSASNGAQIIAAQSNGRRWTARMLADPLGPQASDLTGVSCTSATSCTAVGYFDVANGVVKPLAEVWNGVQWMVETPPTPRLAAVAELNAVSCQSATTCTAVGMFRSSLYGEPIELIETSRGGIWTRETVPRLPNSSLDGVSCTLPIGCIAVGSEGEQMLVVTENGASWTARKIQNPSGTNSGQLAAVSCGSATACFAVGYVEEFNGGFANAVAAEWNGTTWTIQTTPNASVRQDGVTITNDKLDGVSCSSPTACTAVGTNSQKTLAERWDGSSWTIQSTPNPRGVMSADPTAVACASSATCTAVGFDTADRDGNQVNRAIAEGWTAGGWTMETTPGLVGSQLNQIWCSAPTSCTAVGNITTDTGFQLPLVERLS